MDYKIAYTHDGKFNLDDALSAALLKRLYDDIKIKRVPNTNDINDKNAIIYDRNKLIIGGQEKDFEVSQYRSLLYCLVKKICRKEHLRNYDIFFKNMNKLTKGDVNFNPNVIINNLNIDDTVNSSKREQNKRFDKAIGFASALISETINSEYKISVLYDKEAMVWCSGELLYNDKVKYLDKSINYFNFTDEFGDLVLIITKSNRGYMIRSVNFYQLKKCAKLFDHFEAQRSFGICSTKNKAMKAAKTIIENNLYHNKPRYYDFW